MLTTVKMKNRSNGKQSMLSSMLYYRKEKAKLVSYSTLSTGTKTDLSC